MMITGLIVTVLALASLGGSVLLFLRLRASADPLPLVVRIPLIVTPLSIGVLLFTIISLLAAAPFFDWNGAKLAPAFAMLKGYPLYPNRDTGVMTAWIYGPVPALLMLPVALVARSPTTAIVLGAVLNMLLVLVPAMWLHLRTSSVAATDNHRADRSMLWISLLAFAAFAWLVSSCQSTLRSIYMVGPDGPALGLLTCSVALLVGRNPKSRYALVPVALSALSAVLACWCKQSVLPALVVAPLYVLLVDGWLDAVMYAFALFVFGAITSTLFLTSFGPANVWFHMVTLPAHHGWREETTASHWNLFWRACLLLLNEMTPTLAYLGTAMLIGWFLVPRSSPPRERPMARLANWCKANPWIMSPAIAVMLLPASLLGFLKVGGYVNNFGLTHFFVMAAVTVYVIQLYGRAASVPGAQAPTRVVIVALLALFLLTSWPIEFLKRHQIERMFVSIANVRNNQQEVVFAFAGKQSATGYFPWNVLSSLMAEGKYYHFEWGIVDRLEADLLPTRAQSTAHLPAKMQFVGFGPLHQSQASMALFEPPPGQFSHNELPGFVVYPESLANVKARPEIGKATQR